ncbi:MAG: PEP/pyruvate-binding domain-containing protein [Bacteroidota bacterium]
MITYIHKPVSISTAGVTHETDPLAIPQSQLALECVQSPQGFIVTAFAFEEFLTYNSLHLSLHCLMQLLDKKEYSNLLSVAHTAQSLLLSGKMPPSLQRAIIDAYHELGINEPVVVDSHNITVNAAGSIEDTGEEHANAKTVFGEINLLAEVQKRFAALYTGDAIRYRQENNCVHDKAALSIAVQKTKRLPIPARVAETGSLN